MGEINALSCVGQDDVVSLRIVCTMARDGRQHNLEDVDMYGNTALLKACYLGRFECACTLLEFGANIFAMNYFGQNALTLATYAGHLNLVKELLRRRSYKDFNLSSMIPALCVATLQKHSGLGVAELRGMIKAAGRLDKRNARSPPTFITNRLR
uniref:Plu protein n=1 Tax=Drosophila sechellia TaxID=7238 RepID=Q5R270_DROSE|nr:plu [Drosophila sechellia]